jgi:hypothetical protein
VVFWIFHLAHIAPPPELKKHPLHVGIRSGLCDEDFLFVLEDVNFVHGIFSFFRPVDSFSELFHHGHPI